MLQNVSIDFVIIYGCKVLKIMFENMLNITIKMIAYGCSPENGRIPLIVQWYKMVHFMMRNKYLCFLEFVKFCYIIW